MDAQGDPACLSHLGGVPQKSKTGDISGSVESKVNRELGCIAIEAFHPGDGISEFVGRGEIAFEGCGDDAGAERFGKKEAVARACAGFGQELVVLDDSKSNQTKFGLFILDGVPACDDNARFEGFFGSTSHDCLSDIHGQCGREGGNIEREEGFAAHRVDIGESIGGSDRAVVVGVVDNGSEKVDSGDEGLAVVEAPDSGIVSRFKPDEEIRVGFTLKSFFDWQQNLRQRFRVDFGRSTRASGERRQADGWGVSHGLIIPDFGWVGGKTVEPRPSRTDGFLRMGACTREAGYQAMHFSRIRCLRSTFRVPAYRMTVNPQRVCGRRRLK